MKFIKRFRGLLGHIVSSFFPSKNTRRYVRNIIENYSLKKAIKYKNFKHQIISLGNNCMARTITTIYGLKPRKIYGEKTIATDQMFSPGIKELLHLWNTNFEDFFEGLEFSKERNSWFLPKYNSYAPHEFQLSKDEFIKVMKKRIKNFYEVIETDKYAIFLRFENRDCSYENVVLLNNKIKEVRKNKPYKLVIVNHCNPIENINIENTIIINQPMTLSEKWQLELDTEEGRKFCASFINPIIKIIDNIN